MIYNATLQRIDAVAVTAGGDRSYTPGAALAIRCCVDEPTSTQKWELADLHILASSVLYLAKADAGAVVPLLGQQATVLLDGETVPQPFSILWVKDRVSRGLSHFECYMVASA